MINTQNAFCLCFTHEVLCVFSPGDEVWSVYAWFYSKPTVNSLWFQVDTDVTTGCDDVLRSCIRNAGGVSVCVEFVICSTTQNQLERENKMDKRLLVYLKVFFLGDFFSFLHLYICILDAHELTGTKHKQNDKVHRQIWINVVPHSLSSPRTELYLRGQRDHRVALYNCDGREKDDLDLMKNTTAMIDNETHTF